MGPHELAANFFFKRLTLIFPNNISQMPSIGDWY
jgi:hypothetical protein